MVIIIIAKDIYRKTEKNNEVCVDRSHGTYEYVLFRFMNREEMNIYFSCMIINIIQYEIQGSLGRMMISYPIN